MRMIGRLWSWLVSLMALAAACVLVWLMVSIVVSVTMRNAGLQPFAWLFTSAEYGLLYMTMLGAPWLVRERGHVHIELLTAALPEAARVPSLGRVHAGVPLALGLAAVTWLLVFRTAFGFRLRAVGLSPEASRFAGISPPVHGTLALVLAGGLAGLGGAAEVAGVTGRLYEGISPGHGYTAIAVALLARLHPLGAVPAALFFGALEAGSGAMQRQAGVPAVATEIAKGVVVLLSTGLALGARRIRRPPAAGVAAGAGERGAEAR